MPSQVWRGLDLHHPLCESLVANRMFYAIGALAYNLMKPVQLLCLPDESQSWTVATLLRQMVRLPAVLVRHARRLVARVAVAVSWLNWWAEVGSALVDELRPGGGRAFGLNRRPEPFESQPVYSARPPERERCALATRKPHQRAAAFCRAPKTG